MRIALGALIVAVFAVLSLPFQGWGQINPGGCGTTAASACYTQGSGGGGSSIVTGPTMTFQGTLAVTTSAALSTLTLSNSTTWPAAIGKLVVINVGSATAYLCWFGGTCAATGGSEALAAGASDTVYLGGTATSPTAFSTSGSTLAIHN